MERVYSYNPGVRTGQPCGEHMLLGLMSCSICYLVAHNVYYTVTVQFLSLSRLIKFAGQQQDKMLSICYRGNYILEQWAWVGNVQSYLSVRTSLYDALVLCSLPSAWNCGQSQLLKLNSTCQQSLLTSPSTVCHPHSHRTFSAQLAVLLSNIIATPRWLSSPPEW